MNIFLANDIASEGSPEDIDPGVSGHAPTPGGENGGGATRIGHDDVGRHHEYRARRIADDGLSDRAKPPASRAVPPVSPDYDQIERRCHSKHRVLRRPFPDHHADGTRNVARGKQAKLFGRARPTLLPLSFELFNLGRREIRWHVLRRRVKHGDLGIPRRGGHSRHLQGRRRGVVVEVHSDQHA